MGRRRSPIVNAALLRHKATSLDRSGRPGTEEVTIRDLSAHGYSLTAFCGVQPDGSPTCFRTTSCSDPGKHPLTKPPSQMTTRDPVQALSWRRAGHNLAVAVTELVLDIDPRHGGLDSFERLTAEIGSLPSDQRRTDTPGGGFHLYFRVPLGTEVRNGSLLGFPGIDVKTQGGFVLVVGDRPDGTYRHRSGRVPMAPNPLLDLLARRPPRQGSGPDSSKRWGNLWQEYQGPLVTLDLLCVGSDGLSTTPAHVTTMVRDFIEEKRRQGPILEGSRNTTLHAIARGLRGLLIPPPLELAWKIVLHLDALLCRSSDGESSRPLQTADRDALRRTVASAYRDPPGPSGVPGVEKPRGPCIVEEDRDLFPCAEWASGGTLDRRRQAFVGVRGEDRLIRCKRCESCRAHFAFRYRSEFVRWAVDEHSMRTCIVVRGTDDAALVSNRVRRRVNRSAKRVLGQGAAGFQVRIPNGFLILVKGLDADTLGNELDGSGKDDFLVSVRPVSSGKQAKMVYMGYLSQRSSSEGDVPWQQPITSPDPDSVRAFVARAKGRKHVTALGCCEVPGWARMDGMPRVAPGQPGVPVVFTGGRREAYGSIRDALLRLASLTTVNEPEPPVEVSLVVDPEPSNEASSTSFYEGRGPEHLVRLKASLPVDSDDLHRSQSETPGATEEEPPRPPRRQRSRQLAPIPRLEVHGHTKKPTSACGKQPGRTNCLGSGT